MEITPKVKTNGDLLRTLLQVRISKMYMNSLVTENDTDIIPDTIRTGVTRVTREIVELERKILNHTDNQFPWLRKEVEKAKLWDIARVNDLMIRIGHEEDQEVYEDFVGMLIECITSIFYSQKTRKKLHLGKYRALFKIFADEVIADSEHRQGQIMHCNGEIYLRTSPPEFEQELKKED